MTTVAEAVLLITGSMGSGKTTIMFEASDLLTVQGIHHASIDLDRLGTAHFPPEHSGCDVKARNLECVWANYAELGLKRLLLAGAIENRSDLDSLQAAVPARAWVICRLRASISSMQERVRSREPGILQPQFVARVPILEDMLDRATLEDFFIGNEGRAITEVAREVLVRAGWLKPSQS